MPHCNLLELNGTEVRPVTRNLQSLVVIAKCCDARCTAPSPWESQHERWTGTGIPPLPPNSKTAGLAATVTGRLRLRQLGQGLILDQDVSQATSRALEAVL